MAVVPITTYEKDKLYLKIVSECENMNVHRDRSCLTIRKQLHYFSWKHKLRNYKFKVWVPMNDKYYGH